MPIGETTDGILYLKIKYCLRSQCLSGNVIKRYVYFILVDFVKIMRNLVFHDYST